MKRAKNGSTVKQYAYATRRLSGQGTSKKEMARLSGYSPKVADNVKAKVEDTEGYQNAILVLAQESNNLLLAVLTEFKLRGVTKFSNADLTKALNAITGAWERIEKARAPNHLKTPEMNPLRGVFMRRVETQTAIVEEVPREGPNTAPEPIVPPEQIPQNTEEEDMDF